MNCSENYKKVSIELKSELSSSWFQDNLHVNLIIFGEINVGNSMGPITPIRMSANIFNANNLILCVCVGGGEVRGFVSDVASGNPRKGRSLSTLPLAVLLILSLLFIHDALFSFFLSIFSSNPCPLVVSVFQRTVLLLYSVLLHTYLDIRPRGAELYVRSVPRLMSQVLVTIRKS